MTTPCVVPFCPAVSNRDFNGWICGPHFDLVDRKLRQRYDPGLWEEKARQAIWRAACAPMRREMRQ